MSSISKGLRAFLFLLCAASIYGCVFLAGCSKSKTAAAGGEKAGAIPAPAGKGAAQAAAAPVPPPASLPPQATQPGPIDAPPAPRPPKDGDVFGKPLKIDETPLVTAYDVTYWSGGLKVKGKLYEYNGSSIKKTPGIVFNHDGVNGISKEFALKSRQLAELGFNVFAPSFRGEDGSEGQVEVAAGEVEDAVGAVGFLQNRGGTDRSRIAMIGTSHGGIITLLAIERINLSAAVCAYGVSDARTWYKYLVDNKFDVRDPLSLKVYGNGPDDRPAAFDARSPVLNAKKIDTPILLIYGSADRVVPASQGEEMLEAVRNNSNRPSSLFISIAGAEHGFLVYEKKNKAASDAGWRQVMAFLQKYL